MKEKGSSIIKEIVQTLKARSPLAFVNTIEENRFLQALMEELNLQHKDNFELFIWSETKKYLKRISLIDNTISYEETDLVDEEYFDHEALLNALILSLEEDSNKTQKLRVFLVKDIYPYIDENISNPTQRAGIVRVLRDIAEDWVSTTNRLIFINPSIIIPKELTQDSLLYSLPLPDKAYIDDQLRPFITNLSVLLENDLLKEYEEHSHSILSGLTGLSSQEIRITIDKILAKFKKFDENTITEILKEKKQIIAKSGMLEYFDTTDLPQVGGLKGLKDWLKLRGLAFGEDARSVGLPYPKGVFLLGVPGTGKSLIAKVTGREWGLPVVNWDISKMFGSLQGQTEQNVSKAINIIESISPCIVLLDEVDCNLCA